MNEWRNCNPSFNSTAPIEEQPAISISKQLYVKVETWYNTSDGQSVQSTSLPGLPVARLQVWLYGGFQHPRGSQPFRGSVSHPRNAEGRQDWPSLIVYSASSCNYAQSVFGIQNQNKFSISQIVAFKNVNSRLNRLSSLLNKSPSSNPHLLPQIGIILNVISLKHCVLFTRFFLLFNRFLSFFLLIIQFSLIIN